MHVKWLSVFMAALLPVIFIQNSFAETGTPKKMLCDYDVTKDVMNVTTEYSTTAKSGWYSDSIFTPVTTVANITYYVYVTPSLKVRVGRIKSGRVFEFDLDPNYTVTDDGHNEFSIAVDKKGFIHLIGDMHNKSLRYWRSNKAYDPSAFTAHFGAIEGDNFTYPTFRSDRNNELYLLARARAVANYNSIGGRGAGVYYYDVPGGRWTAFGAVPVYPNAQNKMLAWEPSSFSGKNYQLYISELQFDKRNRMHFSVALNAYNAPGLNHAIYAYSDDHGKTFRKVTTTVIDPLPMRVEAGGSQADVIAGSTTATIGERAAIFLDQNNVPGVSYAEGTTTAYRYRTGSIFSSPQIIMPTRACDRCYPLSDQDNGVMTLVDGNALYRFTKFTQKPVVYKIASPILRWDLRALRDQHVYRGVSWDSKTGAWKILRVDITNPTKCF